MKVCSDFFELNVALSVKLRVLFVGAFTISALLLGVYIGAADVW